MSIAGIEETIEALSEQKKMELLKHLFKNHLADLGMWLSDGEKIQMIAWIASPHPPSEPTQQEPNESKIFTQAEIDEWRARLKEIWGDKVYTAEETAAMIQDNRGDRS